MKEFWCFRMGDLWLRRPGPAHWDWAPTTDLKVDRHRFSTRNEAKAWLAWLTLYRGPNHGWKLVHVTVKPMPRIEMTLEQAEFMNACLDEVLAIAGITVDELAAHFKNQSKTFAEMKEIARKHYAAQERESIAVYMDKIGCHAVATVIRKYSEKT